MKLNVFEAFSGIGAQKKAIDFLNKRFGTEYKIVATSDWDIWANISYNAIHFKNDLTPSKNKDQLEMKNFLNKFVHSSNSKSPMSKRAFNNLDEKTIRTLYSSYINSNNLGSIIDVTGEKLLEKVPENENIDMIFYSFPCQDLSSAGKNKGMGSDGNTRSGLLWQIDRILNDLKKLKKLPKFLLLENVLNMISSRHKEDYDKWIDNLKENFGYETRTYKMNALDYGLPQNRKRVYGLSMRPDKGEEFSTIKLPLLDFDEPVDEFEILKNNKIKLNLNNFLRLDYSNDQFKVEAQEAQPMYTPSREKIWNKNPKIYSLLYPESVTKSYIRTITTKQDRNPNAGNIDLEGTILESKNLIWFQSKANFRYLTVRECFLFMGFEDEDYNKIIESGVLKNKREILYRQAGNSIAVNVLEHLFLNIYKKYWSN